MAELGSMVSHMGKWQAPKVRTVDYSVAKVLERCGPRGPDVSSFAPGRWNRKVRRGRTSIRLTWPAMNR